MDQLRSTRINTIRVASWTRIKKNYLFSDECGCRVNVILLIASVHLYGIFMQIYDQERDVIVHDKRCALLAKRRETVS